METFPNERKKISLAHSKQQQNVPSDREQLLGTWESWETESLSKKMPPEWERACPGGSATSEITCFRRQGIPHRGWPVWEGGREVGDGEGEEAVYHRRRTGLRCAT